MEDKKEKRPACLEGWVKSDKLNNTMVNAAREIEVERLKEIFGKKYLLKSGLVTLQEYNAVPLINYRPNRNRVQDFASLSHQVVGAETH